MHKEQKQIQFVFKTCDLVQFSSVNRMTIQVIRLHTFLLPFNNTNCIPSKYNDIKIHLHMDLFKHRPTTGMQKLLSPGQQNVAGLTRRERQAQIAGVRQSGRGPDYVAHFFVSQQYRYLSIVQINPFRPNTSNSATESRSFRFTVKSFSRSALVRWPEKFCSPGREPTLGGPVKFCTVVLNTVSIIVAVDFFSYINVYQFTCTQQKEPGTSHIP